MGGWITASLFFLRQRAAMAPAEVEWRAGSCLLTVSAMETHLRDLLRGSGMPFDQPYAGIRQHTLEELEESLREMLEVYARAVATGDRVRARYCRRVVIAAKERAKFLAKKQPHKEEMVQWMLVWLENPEVFPAWVNARKTRLDRDGPRSE